MKRLIFLLIFVYVISIVFSLTLIITTPTRIKVTKDVAKVAALEISGPIRYGVRAIPGNAERIVERLNKIAKSEKIKGVIIKINSPGGSVASVQSIYDAIVGLKKKGKKAIAFLKDVCFSGGYYVASACDKIVAQRGTMVGSVGVMLEVANVEDLFRKIGMRFETIKSGKYKDIGSPFRRLSDEERRILEALVNGAYEQFISDVSKGRNLPREDVLKFSNGEIFLGDKAKEFGMVDFVGNEETAKKIMCDLIGVKDISIVDEPRYFGIGQLISDLIEAILKISDRGLSTSKMRLEYIFE